MSKSALVQSRVKQETKTAADALFDALGLDTPTAVRMFLTKAVQVGGLPFSVTTVPNSDTRRALAEARADEGLSDPFQSANDMIDAAVADA